MMADNKKVNNRFMLNDFEEFHILPTQKNQKTSLWKNIIDYWENSPKEESLQFFQNTL